MKYRVEIQALYYKDVEADSVDEAKKMVREAESIECEMMVEYSFMNHLIMIN